VAILCGSCLAQFSGDGDSRLIWLLITASLPTFVFGLAEDLTKSVSPRRRLFFTAVSAGLAIFLLAASSTAPRSRASTISSRCRRSRSR
jgi:hypothetical protein